MSGPDDALAADEVQEPSISERDPPRSPLDTDREWQETLDAGRDQGPTSAHEEEGWRALKLF